MKADGFDAAARRGVDAVTRLAWAVAVFPLLPVLAALAAVRLGPGDTVVLAVALTGLAVVLTGALLGRAATLKVGRAFAEAAAFSSPALNLPDARDLLAGLRELAGQASSALGKEDADLRQQLAKAASTAKEAKRLADLLSEKLASLVTVCGESKEHNLHGVTAEIVKDARSGSDGVET